MKLKTYILFLLVTIAFNTMPNEKDTTCTQLVQDSMLAAQLGSDEDVSIDLNATEGLEGKIAQDIRNTGISRMKIVIGSTNSLKVSALTEVIPLFDFLKNSILISQSVPSGISEQPLSLQETIDGAQNRALAAAAYGNIGIGIENGLCNIPGTDRYFDIGVCCIYANNRFAFGFSQGFEIPKSVLNYILNQKLDLSQALNRAGLTHNKQIGAGQGAIGILTKGRITRKDCIKQAMIIALAQLEQPALF